MGAIDSIVDIVGAVIAIKHLGIEKIYFSPRSQQDMDTQHVNTAHSCSSPGNGRTPEDTPAKIRRYRERVNNPTGAAIITTLGEGLRTTPEMRILQIGYGAGSSDNPAVPNLLRILIGEVTPNIASDEMWIVETNIDNMSGEVLGYVMDKLFEAGAVDAYFTPIQMKKGRPGIIISAIVAESSLSAVELVLFNQTTTFGIRNTKWFAQYSPGNLKR